ncbi:MAG TPA: SDR family NAD(P)-dependent oxidoreductase [Mycobacteriales bacterium]|nr:SDR family NAD(P)-dependent oxidoreductase [Mycobacteriales bacterium]
MKVLVTGGTGFVGAHTVAALVTAGHDVRLLARRPERIATTLGELGVDTTRLEVVQGDMVDADAVGRAVAGTDAVIHAAAVVAALDRKHAEQALHTNVDGTRTVLDAAIAAGCDPVVHVSSIAALFTPHVDLLTVDLPPVVDAANPYTRSKALADELARDRQASGAPVVIVYPGGVVGPRVGELCGDAAEGFASILRLGFLSLTDGGINVIDARDLAAVLTATLTPGRGPRRYMAAGQLVMLPDILRMFRQATGRRIPSMPTPAAVYRVLGSLLDAIRRVVPFSTVFTAEAMELLTRPKDSDDSAVHQELDVHYREVAGTIEDGLRGLYAAGHLTAKQAGALAR